MVVKKQTMIKYRNAHWCTFIFSWRLQWFPFLKLGLLCTFFNSIVYFLVIIRKKALQAECRDVSCVCYSWRATSAPPCSLVSLQDLQRNQWWMCDVRNIKMDHGSYLPNMITWDSEVCFEVTIAVVVLNMKTLPLLRTSLTLKFEALNFSDQC